MNDRGPAPGSMNFVQVVELIVSRDLIALAGKNGEKEFSCLNVELIPFLYTIDRSLKSGIDQRFDHRF